MDGNGRWAKQRNFPRTVGHQAGVQSVQRTVEFCLREGIEFLTLFAFSSENWRRPADEVSVLMNLFLLTLQKETARLHDNGVRIRVIGDRSALSLPLQKQIHSAEETTAENTKLNLIIAANYGGRWDIVNATRRISKLVSDGILSLSEIDEQTLAEHISTFGIPDPDLFIRTGGEARISNFLLWQMAYTEFFFSPVLWPDFDESCLISAIEDFSGRQRRFGYTGDQVAAVTPNLN